MSPGAESAVRVHREGGPQLRDGVRPPGGQGDRPRSQRPAAEVAVRGWGTPGWNWTPGDRRLDGADPVFVFKLNWLPVTQMSSICADFLRGLALCWTDRGSPPAWDIKKENSLRGSRGLLERTGLWRLETQSAAENLGSARNRNHSTSPRLLKVSHPDCSVGEHHRTTADPSTHWPTAALPNQSRKKRRLLSVLSRDPLFEFSEFWGTCEEPPHPPPPPPLNTSWVTCF